MTHIELKYDPFSVKTVLTINGKKATLRCFGEGTGIRLVEWINDFFPEVIKKSNTGIGAECSVQFYGTQSDFEEVRLAYKDYSDKNTGIKIELPPYKPYPNNFTEITALILKRRNNYAEQIAKKREELQNPSVHGNDTAIVDLEKKFSNDKKNFEQKYNECMEKANPILAKAAEGFTLIRIDTYAHLDKSDADTDFSKTEAALLELYRMFSEGAATAASHVKKHYDKIAEGIEFDILKNYKDLSNLLDSLLNEQILSRLHSWYEDIFSNYSLQFLKNQPLFDKIEKYKISMSLDDNGNIPQSFIKDLEMKNVPSSASIGNAAIKAKVEKTLNNCQEYMDSLFEIAKQTFTAEAEKIKVYYGDELSELQKTIKEIQSSTLIIEQEILSLENRIECLDELRDDIIKLGTV